MFVRGLFYIHSKQGLRQIKAATLFLCIKKGGIGTKSTKKPLERVAVYAKELILRNSDFFVPFK